MKHFIAVFIAIVAVKFSFSQPQRLALLPSSMNIVKGGISKPSSLCVDFFREIPGLSGSFDSYSHVRSGRDGHSAGAGGLTYDTDTYTSVRVRDANGNLASHSLNDVLYLSTRNDLDGLSPRYKDFISRRMSAYQRNDFNDDLLAKLQDEVWAFDVLEHTGYIDQSGDVVAAYRNGKARFSNDFMEANTTAKEADILIVGQYLKLVKSPFIEVSANGFFLQKSSRTGEYILFNGPEHPLYRGRDISQMADAMARRCNNGELTCLEMLGIENALKEKTITRYIKRKMETVHNKNVSIASLDHEIFWTPQSHRMSTFSESSVRNISQSGHSLYEGKVQFETTTKYFTETSTVEARSPQRNLVVRFFNRCSESLRNLRDRYVLGRRLSAIRNQVMEGMELSDSNYLDIFITTEDNIRTMVRFSKSGIEINYGYASR